jgi:serine/threonine-protein kinase RsbT
VIRVPVRHESDVVAARARAREIARAEGLAGPAAEALALAVTEIARNIVVHAVCGEVLLWVSSGQGRRCIAVEARDEGPGILDVDAAMRDHYSTAGGLGLGLPGARRLVDELEITSRPGVGTIVRMRKWAA